MCGIPFLLIVLTLSGCQTDIVLLVDMSGGALNKRERYMALAGELVRALDIGEFAAQVEGILCSFPDLIGH